LKRRILIIVVIVAILYFFSIIRFNKVTLTLDDAYKIAQKNTPLSNEYRISQLSGEVKWSFLFYNNPAYKIQIVTVKINPSFQNLHYQIIIDAKTGDILEVKQISKYP
jgi:predicted small secreted protein